MSSPSLTVMFAPESAYGPTNQCIGLGRVLLERGHRVVFAAEASWAGRLAPHGFTEALVDLADPVGGDGAAPGAAGRFWIDFVRQTAPEFAKPTIEQLATFVAPTYDALIEGSKYCQPRLRQVIAEHHPDVIVEDNVVAFPALMTGDAAFVRIVSCNPLEVRGPGVPPTFSGYGPAERPRWAGFLAEFDRTHHRIWADFNSWVQAEGAPPLPPREFLHASPDANIYVYPEELDYLIDRRLDSTWHRIDSSVRETDAGWELPAALAARPADSALIYLSLGSLGGADVGLMQRLIDVLARSRHRIIVSMGPRADELRLADSMVGAATLPQTTIIPQVDLVITHGGNNTVTEAMHFGIPMIVLPLFWDQYDNARRVDELGYGIRLPTYEFTDGQLLAAIETVLADLGLRARAQAVGVGIRSRDGVRRGAAIIEQVGLQRLARR